MAVEHHVLSRRTVFQYDAFCARLFVAFLLGFHDDFVHTLHGDVEGIAAVALHIIVVQVGSTVAQVDVVSHVGILGNAVLFFLVLAFQNHVGAVGRGIGECLGSALVVVFPVVPGARTALAGLKVFRQIELEEFSSFRVHVVDTSCHARDIAEACGFVSAVVVCGAYQFAVL